MKLQELKSYLEKKNLWIEIWGIDSKYHNTTPNLFYFQDGIAKHVEWLYDPEGEWVDDGGYWYYECFAYVPYGVKVYEVTKWEYDFENNLRIVGKYEETFINGELVEFKEQPFQQNSSPCTSCRWNSGIIELPCAVNPLEALEGGYNCEDYER